MFRRISPVLAAAAFLLVACGSEQAKVVSYFEESQSIAERMSEVGTAFQTLMNVQENPLAWTDAEKQELDAQVDALQALQDEADSMSVPEAFQKAHPLLVDSIGAMIGAIDIIRGIAMKPESVTEEMGDDMTVMAKKGETLADEYITMIESVLREKYPEMVADGGE